MDMTVAPSEREDGLDDEPWELPAGWCWTPLRAVTSFIGRGRGPKYVEDGGVPVVNQKCIRWHSLETRHLRLTARDAFDRLTPELQLQPGDLLWNSTGTGTIGRAVVYDGSIGELTVDSHVTIVRPVAIEPRYLGYFVETGRVQHLVDAGHVGSTNQRELPRAFVEELRIPLAPLPEQRRIVERIDALFAEIAEGKAALEEARKGLETFRRSLLKAAVTGELTRDWRETNKPTETGHDLIARIRAERAVNTPDRRDKRAWAGESIDTSELSHLPKGWAWARLDEIVVSGPTNGYSPKTSSDGSGTLSLKLTATTRGEIDLSDRATKTLSETIEQGSDLYLVPGDLLFQRGNTIEYVGIAAIYDGPESTYVYPDLMIRVRTSHRWLAEWIWRVANSPMGRKFMMDSATGTAGTMPKISGAILRRLPIPIPPASEIGEILRRVSEGLAACSDGVTLFEVQTTDAVRLRQAILKSAFEGTLVPQDSHDEPASALLTNISARTVNPSKRHRAPAKKTRGRSST
ncbi:restriction endonuclease subunit S [Rhizobium leucaenae]|uniref:Type I restriction enzyme S subunit n=1 Tax=Rhizobium leucaenae TaxID=29450 RepID=A0A7W6ZS98_9HYPH|nr:restriction endonuclease subunit S [Rhizobium leucaenae]MBB4567821.1 type I restriction enzyme S subunit [Rhizobium leucaenae]